jgi:dCTP deaminase
MSTPSKAARRRHFRRRAWARRSRNREFGSSGSNSIDTGAGTLFDLLWNRNSYDPPVVLSDRTIRRLIDEGRIGIDPFDPSLMQPSSLDVRVDRLFRVFRNSRYPYIDVKQAQDDLTELVAVDGDEAFILHPGEFVLGSTLERVTLPDDLVARLEGKSSLGRLGLLIHSTAGFIDPGWDGHVTLELSNVANLPITIYPGMKIGQVSFVQLSEPAETPYGAGALGSKYQGQQGPTPSRYYRNFEED